MIPVRRPQANVYEPATEWLAGLLGCGEEEEERKESKHGSGKSSEKGSKAGSKAGSGTKVAAEGSSTHAGAASIGASPARPSEGRFVKLRFSPGARKGQALELEGDRLPGGGPASSRPGSVVESAAVAGRVGLLQEGRHSPKPSSRGGSESRGSGGEEEGRESKSGSESEEEEDEKEEEEELEEALAAAKQRHRLVLTAVGLVHAAWAIMVWIIFVYGTSPSFPLQ